MTKKWKTPKWMHVFALLISDFRGVEEAMNCDGRNCNVETNAPKAIMCAMLRSEVVMLMRLYNEGLLKEVK